LKEITVEFKEILILPGEAEDKGELSNDMNESFRSLMSISLSASVIRTGSSSRYISVLF
jgi:hypothetical protein